MLAQIKAEPIIALDTESDSLYRYFYRVCLIQLSTPTEDYLLDPLRLPDMMPLAEVLADPAIEKVFHAAENDILTLKRDFGFRFASVFDTMLAARILGGRQVSLAAQLAQHFGVTLDKRVQLTDWGHRPLTSEQLSYARLDSRYLLPLRDLLRRELQARNRWREACEAFAALPKVTYVEKPFDPEGFWHLRDTRDLQGRELAVLRELYLLRDELARSADRPAFKIIGDHELIRLSLSQPRHTNDLRLGPWQTQRFGRAILEAVGRGVTAPIPQPPPRVYNGNGRPDPATLARYERLRAWRTQRAAARGVESDIVLTNEALQAIARAAPMTLDDLAALGLLGPWKLDEYGAELLNVARG